jgi:rhomboid protease GluP
MNNGSASDRNFSAAVSATDGKQERRRQIQVSYRRAMGEGRTSKLGAFPWATLFITLLTLGIWCVTAYQVALSAGAHTLKDVLASVFAESENGDVLIAFGAKYNIAIIAGQYWRLVTPIFLHATILHVGLNMLNFLLLGLILERIFGHTRFILIYLFTGMVSILASFLFAPQEISVGASGAIFGLVGAYSIFVARHRRAFWYGGVIALSWLLLVIGVNVGLGFVIPDVDNYAHVGGLLTGCLLGWFFAPFYVVMTREGQPQLADVHSLMRRWPLALFFSGLLLLIAIIAIHSVGG